MKKFGTIILIILASPILVWLLPVAVVITVVWVLDGAEGDLFAEIRKAFNP